MTLANRAWAALRGNINAMLNRFEESSGDVTGLLDQMGHEIQNAKRELLRLMGEEKHLREQAKNRLIEAERWQSRAQLAVQKGDDSLARDALIQYRQMIAESERDHAAAEKHGVLVESIKGDIKRIEEKHSSIASRKGTIIAAAKRSQLGGGVESLGAIGARRPFDDLKRIEASIDDVELTNEAVQEVGEMLSPGIGKKPHPAGLSQRASQDALAAESSPEPEAGRSPDGSVSKRRVRVE
jgi:phage shock protein A